LSCEGNWNEALPPGMLPAYYEFAVFLCLHVTGGKEWKQGGVFQGAPRWVAGVMRNNFRQGLTSAHSIPVYPYTLAAVGGGGDAV